MTSIFFSSCSVVATIESEGCYARGRQQIAALVEEASAASQQASELADALMSQVAVFRFAGQADKADAVTAKPVDKMPSTAPLIKIRTPVAPVAVAASVWREF